MARPIKAKSLESSSANLGFEAKLWLSADKLRNNMDAAEFYRWHGAAAEKEQPQVDPQGAAMQRRQFGVPVRVNLNY